MKKIKKEPQIFNRVIFSNIEKKDYYQVNKKRALKAIKMIAAHELKLRNEGRDFFKKELLLDIKSNEKRGWEIEMILDSVKNLLK
jgi:hypothetical protein